ncbi:MAG: PDZ domain-containing protein, partial [Calditrichia bacterium]|nr:PDZ domain-containing protein [Calditrichia bacterium]
DDKKKVKEKKVWVQTTEKKAGLGVMVSTIDKDDPDSAKEGARIVEVFKGSEAERIGLKKGDVIVNVNGKSIEDPTELADIFKEVEEGAEVKLSILREGEKKSFTAKLKPFDGHAYAFKVNDEDGDILIDVFRTSEHDKDFRVIRSSGINATTGGKGGYLGVQVKDLSDQLQEYFEVKNGVLVEEVMKDSPAEKAGLKAGDVIVSINDRKLEDYHDLIRTVNFYNPEEEVAVSYVRKGDTEETKVVLGKKPAYHWKTKKMKGPQSLQFISEDGEKKILITEDPDKKAIWVDENDANFNVEIKKEFFIL